MKKVLTIVMGLGVLLALAMPGLAVTIETVPVGDPNNAPDTRYDPNGFGRVPYEYRIGKYEVTAGQYCEFLNAVAKTDTYGLYNRYMDYDAYAGYFGCNIKRTASPGTYEYSVASDWANRPVNWVSWGDAARFCNWLHNGQPTGLQSLSTTEDGAYYLNGAVTDAALLAVTREADWRWAIPSEDEWYKAAYYDPNKPGGAGYWDYPTSSNTVPGRDTTETTNPANNANYPTSSGGYLIGSPYYRTPVGEFELSDSPYGTFDQGGNVWEWNEATITDGYHWYRGLRGGSFAGVSSVAGYMLRASVWFDDSPSHQETQFGFRVSQVPEPTCLVILALGGLALLRRRR